jgi:hypothetical protein
MALINPTVFDRLDRIDLLLITSMPLIKISPFSVECLHHASIDEHDSKRLANEATEEKMCASSAPQPKSR